MILRFILFVLLLPFVIVFLCGGHYRNHTAEWLERRGYRSEEEIIVRIFEGCWGWVVNP